MEPGANQRPSKVIYDRDGSSIALAKPGDIDWTKTFEGAGWFHITGITPALSQSAADIALESVRRAYEAGLKVSCDLNYRKNLWKYGKKPSEVMAELFKFVHVGIANEEDCQMALGIEAEADVHAGKLLDREQYRKLTETVLAGYPNLELIAITLRESHSASHNGWSAPPHNDRKEFLIIEALRHHAYRRHRVGRRVTSFGTRDSIYGLLHQNPPNENGHQSALEFAVAASCLKHSIPGDFNRFTVEEVDSLIKGGGSGRVQR